MHELHSKIGASYDIHHRDGDVFEACNYGEEYAYMRRPKADRYKTAEILPHQCQVLIGNEVHMLIFDGATLISNKIIGRI